MTRKNLLILLGIFLLTGVFFLAGCPESSANSSGNSFELEDLDGNIVKSTDFEGKVVVMDFWATWCPPCRQATPYMIKLHKRYEGKDVIVVGVNLDYDKTKEDIKTFADREGIKYLILKGDQKTAGKFKVRGIPKFVVLGKDGSIKKEYTGFSPQLLDKMIPTEIDKLLEE